MARASSTAGRIRHYLRIFVAHLFSHVGLCGLVVGYSIMGAFLFERIEADFELQQRRRMAVSRAKCLQDLWNITGPGRVIRTLNDAPFLPESLNILYEERWKALVRTRLKTFETGVLQAAKNDGYDGKEPEDTERQWAFSGSLLYSVTIITTIGYGNIAPKTNTGKIMTMLYALLGIPLMLLYLANIGSFLANAFKFTYSKLCRCRSIRKRPRYLVVSENIHLDNVPSLQISESNPQESFAVLSQQDSLQPSSCLVEIGESTSLTQEQEKDRSVPHNSSFFTLDGDAQKDVPSMNQVRVPISLVLQVLVLYICIGAAIFSQWEGWDLLNGAYFCFVTLTTIGFGDLVPGSSVLSAETEEAKIVICCLYLLLGLATLAMALSLVQEEVVARLKNIGRVLGIVQE